VVRFLIKRPIAVVATLIAFIALGIISVIRMPVSLLPDIDIPEISIRVIILILERANWKMLLLCLCAVICFN